MEMSSPVPLSPSSALCSLLPKQPTSDSTTAVTSMSCALFGSSTLQVGTSLRSSLPSKLRTTPMLIPLKNTSAAEQDKSTSRIPRRCHHTTALPREKPTVTVSDLQYVIDEECSKLCSTDRKSFVHPHQ